MIRTARSARRDFYWTLSSRRGNINKWTWIDSGFLALGFSRLSQTAVSSTFWSQPIIRQRLVLWYDLQRYWNRHQMNPTTGRDDLIDPKFDEPSAGFLQLGRSTLRRVRPERRAKRSESSRPKWIIRLAQLLDGINIWPTKEGHWSASPRGTIRSLRSFRIDTCRSMSVLKTDNNSKSTIPRLYISHCSYDIKKEQSMILWAASIRSADL